MEEMQCVCTQSWVLNQVIAGVCMCVYTSILFTNEPKIMLVKAVHECIYPEHLDGNWLSLV